MVLWEDKLNRQTISQTHQEKREKNQINRNKNENGEIPIGNTEIWRFIRDYYKQLYDNGMDNLEEMDKFLEMYNFPKLNQEEIEKKILNRPITSMEKTTLLHCWWECKLMQPQWKMVWRFLKKTRNKTTIWHRNPTPRHIPWGNQNWKRHMYPIIHCSTIYNS